MFVEAVRRLLLPRQRTMVMMKGCQVLVLFSCLYHLVVLLLLNRVEKVMVVVGVEMVVKNRPALKMILEQMSTKRILLVVDVGCRLLFFFF